MLNKGLSQQDSGSSHAEDRQLLMHNFCASVQLFAGGFEA